MVYRAHTLTTSWPRRCPVDTRSRSFCSVHSTSSHQSCRACIYKISTKHNYIVTSQRCRWCWCWCCCVALAVTLAVPRAYCERGKNTICHEPSTFIAIVFFVVADDGVGGGSCGTGDQEPSHLCSVIYGFFGSIYSIYLFYFFCCFVFFCFGFYFHDYFPYAIRASFTWITLYNFSSNFFLPPFGRRWML